MARQRNTTQTVTLTISTTPQVRDLLERIAEGGLMGKNAAEVAERMIADRLVQLRGREAGLWRAMLGGELDGGDAASS